MSHKRKVSYVRGHTYDAYYKMDILVVYCPLVRTCKTTSLTHIISLSLFLQYFKDFWSVLEFVLLCFAVACIVLYAFKHILTEVAMKALHNRKSGWYFYPHSIISPQPHILMYLKCIFQC